MAVIADGGFDDENVKPIPRRFDTEHLFGVTEAKKFPPYVFSVRGTSCLVHKVARVEMHWWRIACGGHQLVKLKRPVMIATTTCGQHFRLEGSASRTCFVPSPDALPCGRCNGDLAPFGKHGWATKAGIKRQEAHVKLGCVVQGY